MLITAHSLPLRVLEDDPYVAQLTSSAADRRGGLAGPDRWSLGWQSAGRTPEPWMGPDILDELKRLAADEHTDGVLVVPHGFTSDHLGRWPTTSTSRRPAWPSRSGWRSPELAVVNDDPTTMGELAELIHDQVPETGLPADAIET
ncbi:MAG: ferrochelatase [Acidimicrobiales bacterium]